MGSHTPPEDRQARLSGAGREYIRQGRNSRTEEEKASLGVPAIKQVRQFCVKTRTTVELSSKNKLLIGFNFMI